MALDQEMREEALNEKKKNKNPDLVINKKRGMSVFQNPLDGSLIKGTMSIQKEESLGLFK